jgi:hypothetical protein
MDLVIRNCKFIYECPLMWDALGKTNKDHVRHCHVCDKDVFLCEDGAALLDALRFDRCVAVKGKISARTDETLLGIPDSKYVTFEYRDDLKE